MRLWGLEPLQPRKRKKHPIRGEESFLRKRIPRHNPFSRRVEAREKKKSFLDGKKAVTCKFSWGERLRVEGKLLSKKQ